MIKLLACLCISVQFLLKLQLLMNQTIWVDFSMCSFKLYYQIATLIYQMSSQGHTNTYRSRRPCGPSLVLQQRKVIENWRSGNDCCQGHGENHIFRGVPLSQSLAHQGIFVAPLVPTKSQRLPKKCEVIGHTASERQQHHTCNNELFYYFSSPPTQLFSSTYIGCTLLADL